MQASSGRMEDTDTYIEPLYRTLYASYVPILCSIITSAGEEEMVLCFGEKPILSLLNPVVLTRGLIGE